MDTTSAFLPPRSHLPSFSAYSRNSRPEALLLHVTPAAPVEDA